MPGNNQLLKKQLELARFEHAIDYVGTSAQGQKHLNAQELANINNLLTGLTGDPWRFEEVTLLLPSGKMRDMTVISNPLLRAREIIFQARDESSQGEVAKAASALYVQLVMEHLFKDANRRTAVAAVTWLLLEKGIFIPAMGLLEMGLGDLRTPGQIEAVQSLIQHTIIVAQNRKS